MNNVTLVEEPLASELVKYFHDHVKTQVFRPISNCNVFEYDYEGVGWRFTTDKSTLDLIGIYRLDDTTVRVDNRLFVEPLLSRHIERLEEEGSSERTKQEREGYDVGDIILFNTRVRHWDVLLRYGPKLTPKIELERATWIDPDQR